MKKLSLLVLIVAAFVLAIGTQASAKSADQVPPSSSSISREDLSPGYGGGTLTLDPDLATDELPELYHPGVELIVDSDGDGILDPFDNCPDVINPPEEVWPADGWGPPELKQLDADDDGVGDVCDNCPEVENPDQEDTFGDPDAGDACEPELGEPLADSDSDGVSDVLDNCPDYPNADQADEDGDDVGDLCDVCLGDPDPLHQDLNDCVVSEDEEAGEEEAGDEEAIEESGSDEDMNYFDLPDENLDDTTDSNMEMSGGCSMVPAATVNPLMFLLISAAFIPVATRRKE